MRDPLEVLRSPVEPVEPDRQFAARLRRQIHDSLLAGSTDTGGSTMTDTQVDPHEVSAELHPWPPTVTPYIVVADARQAIDWYVDVFGGHRRGALHVNADGTIGHAEVGIGDAVVMIAEVSSLYPDTPVAPPDPQTTTFSHTIHLQVDDVDDVTRRAIDRGATVERQPTDAPYGRVSVIVDPSGHRWMVNRPPASATRVRHGDIGYVTLSAPDDERAKAFYGAVFGWTFTPGHVEHGWQIEGRTPPMAMRGDSTRTGTADLCYRVVDIAAAIERIRAAGGHADDPKQRPFGLLAACTDDQDTPFYIWQPID